MAIDFPASPLIGQTHTVGNTNYIWDGVKWTASVIGGIAFDKIEEGNTSVEVVDTGTDGHVVVSTEGVERLRVDEDGNVEIAGTGKRIRGDFNNATHANRLSFQTSTTDGNTSVFAIPNGTGTSANYVVANASDPTNCSFGQLVVNPFEVDVVSSTLGSGSALPLRLRTIGSSDIHFLTSNTERARIDGEGRLLVGTSSARNNFFNLPLSAALQIEGVTHNNSSLSLIRNESIGGSQYGPNLVLGSSGGTTVGSNTLSLANGQLGTISFQGTDGTEFVEAAQIRVDVDGTPGANDMPGRLVFSTTADGASSPTERMRINSAGDIFFNTTSYGGAGGITLQDGTFGGRQLLWNRNTDTNATYPLAFLDGGSVVGSVAYTNTATIYNTSSDYRLKENITPIADAIGRLNQLKPCRFNFIVDPSKVVDGFIAHEAHAVVPECVTGEKDAVNEDGSIKPQGIDQSKLVPLLTAALQEAIGEIESLKARVAALENPTP